jgi:P pilus assembly chaperone PapD
MFMRCGRNVNVNGFWPLVLIAAIVVSTPVAEAMSVQPVVLEIHASGTGNTAAIAVINDGAAPLPVEIKISRIELDESGEIARKPADDDFLVFPPQAMVPPGATQSFRVQWAGDPQIKQSQSYVLSTNQVPVKMPAGKSGVQVVFNFATIVNVAPAAGQSAINVVSAALGKDDKGKPRPALTVKNPGNIHAKLTDATINLSGGSWSQTLRPEQLRQSMGVGLIQPGKTRRFLLPVDLPAGVTQLTASVDYKPAK